ncbi:unnamed protein product [Withania somnifera]
MAYHVTNRAQSSSTQPPLVQNLTDDPVNPKNAQSSVTSVYQSHIGGYWRNVTVIWINNLMNHSVNLMIDSVESDYYQTCKIDLKPWHFWTRKGYKTFDVDGNQLEAYWDLRSAKFSGSPEPCSDFYVALVSEEEVVLLLGDNKKKAYKKTKARPALKVTGHGLFIFKPGASEDDSDREESSVGGGSDCSDHSKYYSTLSYSKASPFCLFLYAWKIE